MNHLFQPSGLSNALVARLFQHLKEVREVERAHLLLQVQQHLLNAREAHVLTGKINIEVGNAIVHVFEQVCED